MALQQTFYQLMKSAPKGRFAGVSRHYTPEDVVKLRGSLPIEYTLANVTANKLWQSLHTEPYVPALGALTGNQAVQMVRAGLKAIYLSGWQVAADNNLAGDMYPDQSLYPANSGPELVRKINRALRRADQIETAESEVNTPQRDWFKPIVADAEAGFGGSLNCFELTKQYIEAGAAGVHFEDQLGSEKKCGHMGGKVLIPTSDHIRHLNAARLAADVCGVPTVLISRTDAEAARLMTSDVDERDQPFIDQAAGRTAEGFYRLKDDGVAHSIERAINCAPFADLIWMETSVPSLSDARDFADAVLKVYPNKMLAYNCSPSFNWKVNLTPNDVERFQRELGAMGYKFQFITLAGFHANNFAVFDLANKYRETGMVAYTELQEKEFDSEKIGYTAVKHQREVGTSYFDFVARAIHEGDAATLALEGSTEEAQFKVSEPPEPSADEIVTITMPDQAEHSTILTKEALSFLVDLHRRFDKKRHELLAARVEVQSKLDSGIYFPDFNPDTQYIRAEDWTVTGPIPNDMKDRRVEITGPVDRKMVINALNSGAKVYMADFEDSNTPMWTNQIEGQVNLRDAIRRDISYTHPITKKEYTLKKETAVLNVRPRGWHLPEKHVIIDGQSISGSLFDFGLFAFHNARELLDRGSGAYFYLPKLQNAKEAALWNEVMDYTEERLELPKGSIKCTVLIEHILAAFEMNEILFALKDHILGLNCGRWDYIFSFIKTFRNHRRFTLPDRFQIGMTTPFMKAYSLLTIQTCHKRGAQAMGGMAAQIPIKNNVEENNRAMSLVEQDKVREATDGHDGTWVAHPDLVKVAMNVFGQYEPEEQLRKMLVSVSYGSNQLTEVPDGTRTEDGLRRNINVTLGYLDSWLRGVGCVPLYNLMEDAATAEISRAQLWQWLKHEAKLKDGRKVDVPLVRQTIGAETERWLVRAGSVVNKLPEAADMLERFALEPQMSDFLTLGAYDQIVSDGK